jgi:uncharacterized protein YjiS (DUF1127 family)
MTKSHQIVTLKNKPSAEELNKMTAAFCSVHPEEQIKLYCKDCQKVVCMVCHATEHNKHACLGVKESAEQFRVQLNEDINQVDRCVQQSQVELKRLKTDKEDFMQTIRATEREIVQSYYQLRALIDSHKLELIRELNAIKDRRLKDIAVQKDEEERQFVMLESFKKYCEGLRDKGTAWDVSRAAWSTN